MQELETAGVTRETLNQIAGDDHAISGAELGRLYDALAVRGAGTSRVDGRVSEDLFRSLASRVEHNSGSPAELSSGSARTRRAGIASSTVDQSTDVHGRTDGQRPGWFMHALEKIAEFFVELFGGNYVTSDELDYDVGRRMANEHPETLRAILAHPEGEELLRARLLAQRPQNTSEGDWNRAINDVMRGVRETLNRSAPDLPDDQNIDANLLVRDRAAQIFAARPDPAARRELSATVDALARSGLSEQTQLAMLSAWDANGGYPSFRRDLLAFNTSLAAMSPAVRQEAVAQLDASPDHFPRLSTLVASEGFRSAFMADAERLALLRSNAGRTEDVVGLATLLSSERGRALTAAQRTAIIDGFNAHPLPSHVLVNLNTLLQNRGFLRVSETVQSDYLRLMTRPQTSAGEAGAALDRLSNAQSGTLAPLNDVLFGTRTLARGATGPDVRATQRYLRELGYDGILGQNETDTFGASMTAAVTEFQRRAGLLNGVPPAATAGVVNGVTLDAIEQRVHTRGMDPLDYRFTTELSLNRPTRTTDGPWRATQRWTPALQQEFSQFAAAYTHSRIPLNPDGTSRKPEWGERVDCADLSYEALIQFARQRQLPIYLRAGSTTFTHRSAGPITQHVQAAFGAMNLQSFTVPLGRGESPRPGDLGNMRWAQSTNGHDSHYWHSHNIVSFDPLFREAHVIYGSLDDLIKQASLDTFNTRGYNLTLHDVPEVEIIDAINDDSGQHRQVDRPIQERRVRDLLRHHTTGGHQVSQDDVDAFIAMVQDGSNIMRDQPTAVSEDPYAFHGLVDGTPWADPTARTAAVADLNRRFGASFTEADIDRLVAAGSRTEVTTAASQLVEQRVPLANRAGARDALIAAARGTVRFNADRDALSDPGLRASAISDFNSRFGARVRDQDMLTVLNAGFDALILGAARTVVAERGVPAARREEAARALIEAADGTRRLRRWDFDTFNRHM